MISVFWFLISVVVGYAISRASYRQGFQAGQRQLELDITQPRPRQSTPLEPTHPRPQRQSDPIPLPGQPSLGPCAVCGADQHRHQDPWRCPGGYRPMPRRALPM